MTNPILQMRPTNPVPSGSTPTAVSASADFLAQQARAAGDDIFAKVSQQARDAGVFSAQQKALAAGGGSRVGIVGDITRPNPGDVGYIARVAEYKALLETNSVAAALDLNDGARGVLDIIENDYSSGWGERTVKQAEELTQAIRNRLPDPESQIKFDQTAAKFLLGVEDSIAAERRKRANRAAANERIASHQQILDGGTSLAVGASLVWDAAAGLEQLSMDDPDWQGQNDLVQKGTAALMKKVPVDIDEKIRANKSPEEAADEIVEAFKRDGKMLPGIDEADLRSSALRGGALVSARIQLESLRGAGPAGRKKEVNDALKNLQAKGGADLLFAVQRKVWTDNGGDPLEFDKEVASMWEGIRKDEAAQLKASDDFTKKAKAKETKAAADEVNNYLARMTSSGALPLNFDDGDRAFLFSVAANTEQPDNVRSGAYMLAIMNQRASDGTPVHFANYRAATEGFDDSPDAKAEKKKVGEAYWTTQFAGYNYGGIPRPSPTQLKVMVEKAQEIAEGFDEREEWTPALDPNYRPFGSYAGGMFSGKPDDIAAAVATMNSQSSATGIDRYQAKETLAALEGRPGTGELTASVRGYLARSPGDDGYALFLSSAPDFAPPTPQDFSAQVKHYEKADGRYNESPLMQGALAASRARAIDKEGANAPEKVLRDEQIRQIDSLSWAVGGENNGRADIVAVKMFHWLNTGVNYENEAVMDGRIPVRALIGSESVAVGENDLTKAAFYENFDGDKYAKELIGTPAAADGYWWYALRDTSTGERLYIDIDGKPRMVHFRARPGDTISPSPGERKVARGVRLTPPGVGRLREGF